MLKVAAALIIILTSGAIGLTLARGLNQRTRQIRELLLALQALETEIFYGATPLPLALGRVAGTVSQPVRRLFELVRDRLGSPDVVTVREAWEEAVGAISPETVMASRELEILTGLGHGLGASDRQDQARRLQLARAQLREVEQSAEVERTRYEQMFRSLGFLFGLLVVLVIY